MSEFQLAQLNIAKGKGDMDSPVMKGFVDRLDEINLLAEQSPGFVWRLQDNAGDATAMQAFDDPKIIVNMSVWEDLESLQSFVYKTVHVELLQGKKSWFDKMEVQHQVLWWLPAGAIPTVEDGKQRLQLIREHGPHSEAFTFAKAFPPE